MVVRDPGKSMKTNGMRDSREVVSHRSTAQSCLYVGGGGRNANLATTPPMSWLASA
eukprot:CAMPEP_0175917566 /NCGR_PEP_ID=MMETSP0108-20121206/11428_1 /TAXON_ID=195067 ORGANISM="Goniomonas pacifica, Strain CCMP1869" /NCGR_SAMPLE_ID=MMETSP0108 /ASSEMBLY_ACC=CAM_ASM_000204 /LENGTH=55 /DNA_ID=CAMNT_0017240153 /DNA_START=1217 /DNA_END=1384 /DNA_ORIENTATION=-